MWPGGNSWSDESDELFQQTPFPHTPEEIRHKTTKPLKKHQISMSYCWNRHFFQIFSQMACSKCRPKQNTRFKETNCQLLPSDLLIPQMEVIYITPEQVTSNHPEKVTNGRTWWLIFVEKNPDNQPAWRIWGDPNLPKFSKPNLSHKRLSSLLVSMYLGGNHGILGVPWESRAILGGAFLGREVENDWRKPMGNSPFSFF